MSSEERKRMKYYGDIARNARLQQQSKDGFDLPSKGADGTTVEATPVYNEVDLQAVISSGESSQDGKGRPGIEGRAGW